MSSGPVVRSGPSGPGPSGPGPSGPGPTQVSGNASRRIGLVILVLALLALRAPLPALDLPLCAPLGTVYQPAEPLPRAAGVIIIDLTVDDDAPADLGFGAFVRTDDGHWFQRTLPTSLGPGHHILRFPLDQTWVSEPRGETWSAYERSLVVTYGFFAWSASTSRSVLHIDSVTSEAAAGADADGGSLRDLSLGGCAGGHPHGRTGERWTLTVDPRPGPANPYDPAEFSLDLEVTPPDGPARRIPGFFNQPMQLNDRGDREIAVADGAARFEVRYRPSVPGAHQLRLIARWAGGTDKAAEKSFDLPALIVDGEPRDEIVHVDAGDHRFLSVDGAFCWPIGLNFASPHDDGATKDGRYGIIPTPDRGTFSYAAYFARLGAAGGTAGEVWLSTWNLGLEWQSGYPGYHGIGRYNEANAARLDRTLDLAWSHGIRLVLNLNNHGQVLAGANESQWQSNPINRANGGWIDDPRDIFTDPAALRAQANLRRYLAARYADHPGVLIWKLWSEVDLTQLGITTIRQWRDPSLLAVWHAQACADWHRLDTYHHPVATHFATTYQNAHPKVVQVAQLDAIGLDAYFQPGVYTHAESLFGLMVDTMFDPGDGWRVSGVAKWNKPVFITEYGGGWKEASKQTLAIEHRSGAWLALVTGEAASPMLWFHEWVDQTGAWAPYGAIARFIAGEDLRGEGAASATLVTEPASGRLWAQAWCRHGRMLGYVQDAQWATDHTEPALRSGDRLVLGNAIAAGTMNIAWWDADRGVVIRTDTITHPGGRLEVTMPDFSAHLAFKAWRP